MTIIIDESLKSLIPPLTGEESQQLEDNLLTYGCRDALLVWLPGFIQCQCGGHYEEDIYATEDVWVEQYEKFVAESVDRWVCTECGDWLEKSELDCILVDGHNRFEICTRLNIPYQIDYMRFDSISDVKVWMIKNQFGRRNLSNFVRAELALQLKPLIAELAKENLVKSGENFGKGCLKSDNPIKSIDTKKELAKQAGVGHDTIAKVEKILLSSDEKVIEKVKAGELSINQAHKIVTGKESYSDVTKKIKELDIKPQSEVNAQSQIDFDVLMGDVYIINNKHRLIIGDCTSIDFVKSSVTGIDCVLTDPPYGINYKSPSGNGLTQRGNYDVIHNDDQEFDPAILFQYSDNVITWGANHYASKLPLSPGWIVWDKRDGEQINNNSDCELAWSNMLNSARLFHHKWNGMIKDSEHGVSRIHPTQKPIKLMAYCLEICRAGENVLDLYAGSGTTLIACEETGRVANLVEISPVYGAAMLKRFIEMGYQVSKAA